MLKCDLLKNIVKYNQYELKDFVKGWLEYFDYDYEDGNGYLYGKGDIPIMLIAHLDTVHKEKPRQIYVDSEEKVMWSPEGIGGDDRCGVYLILSILKKYKPYVLFLEDEETGGIGARKLIETGMEMPNINFIIELDRRNNNDCVFYDCDNKDFKEYIKSFGFVEKNGTFTDICVLNEVWDVASVNLSVGYVNEHTNCEIIHLDWLKETYEKVCKILEDKESKYYNFQKEEIEYKPLYKKNNKRDEYAYDDYGYIDEDGKYHYWEE